MAQLHTEVLRIVGGRRQQGASAGVVVLTSPLRPAPGREHEVFLTVLDLGTVPSRLYREVREAAAQTFWDTSGSTTAALRRSVAAANRILFRRNRDAVSRERLYGAISCAALRWEELFLAQAGPACAWLLSAEGLTRLHPFDLPSPGTAPYAEVCMTYLTFEPGDTLLLATQGLARSASDDAIRRVLSIDELEGVIDGLEQVAGREDLTALVVRRPTEEPAGAASPRPRRRRRVRTPAPMPPLLSPPARERPPSVEPVPPDPSPVPVAQPAHTRERVIERPEEVEIPVREPVVAPVPPPPRLKGPSLWERIRPRDRLRRLGRWAAGAGTTAYGGLRTLFRRALPGRGRRGRHLPRERRPPPPENPRLMAGLALAILLLVAAITLVTWLTYGATVRRQQALIQARRQAALARRAGNPTEAHHLWEEVLQTLTGLEEDPEAAALQAQAQEALDRIEKVVRVEPTLLMEMGEIATVRRLVAYGPNLFLLDKSRKTVIHLAPDEQMGNELEVDELAIPPAGVERGDVELVDMTWIPAGDGWPSNTLVVLDTTSRLWVYDPLWPDNIRSIPLGSAPGEGMPVAIATFEGRLYLLDPASDQIWRYRPRDGGYPDRAEPFFPTRAPQPLAGAHDFAIDGNIYILFRDGSISKYFRGEPAFFQVTGVPVPAPLFVSLAVTPQETGGRIYLADGADERIVILNSEGGFEAQMRAPPGIFRDLRILALNDTGTRLLAVAGGRLYTLPLPPLP